MAFSLAIGDQPCLPNFRAHIEGNIDRDAYFNEIRGLDEFDVPR